MQRRGAEEGDLSSSAWPGHGLLYEAFHSWIDGAYGIVAEVLATYAEEPPLPEVTRTAVTGPPLASPP